MYQVYKITNIINNKNYIGITTRGLENRWKEHLSVANNQNSKDYNALFKKAIRKYGKENFKIELLENCNSIENMKEKEKFYIAKYNSYAFSPNGWGYNSTMGGDGVFGYGKAVVMIDPLTCELEEYFNTIAEAESFYGRGVLECCKNYQNSHFKKIFLYYEDYKDKTLKEIQDIIDSRLNIISQLDLNGNFIKNWYSSTEVKKQLNYSQANISSCCIGTRKQANGYQWCYRKNLKNYLGKTVKTNHTTAKKVNQYDLKGNFIKTWNSITEAANELKICGSKITCVCKGSRKTTGGFKWSYYEE